MGSLNTGPVQYEYSGLPISRLGLIEVYLSPSHTSHTVVNLGDDDGGEKSHGPSRLIPTITVRVDDVEWHLAHVV